MDGNVSRKNSNEEASLAHLSRVHRTQFNERRKVEWKALLGTLSLYVLVVAATYAEDFRLPGTWLTVLLLVAVGSFFAIASCIYLWKLHQANRINKDFAEAAESEMIERLGVTELLRARSSAARNGRSAVGNNWSLRWQITVVVLFAVTSMALMLAELDWPLSDQIRLGEAMSSPEVRRENIFLKPDVLLVLAVHASFLGFLAIAIVKNLTWRRPGLITRGPTSWRKFYLIQGLVLLLLYQTINSVQVTLPWNFLPLLGLFDFLAVSYLSLRNGWFRNWVLGMISKMETVPE